MSLPTASSSTSYRLVFFLFYLLVTTSHTRELYAGDISAANNFVFTNLEVKQTFECRNLLINTMRAEMLRATDLTMDQIYVEEILNTEAPYIILQGSLNIRGSMSWNPESPQTSTNTTPETTQNQETAEIAGNTETSASSIPDNTQNTVAEGITGATEATATVQPAENIQTTEATAESAGPTEPTETGAPGVTESVESIEGASSGATEATEGAAPETAQNIEAVGAAGVAETNGAPQTTEPTGATTTAEPASPEAAPIESPSGAEGAESTAAGTEVAATSSEEAAPVSFLKVDSLILNGVRQWAMIDHENFDSAEFSLLQVNSKDLNGWRVKGNEGPNFESIVSPRVGSIYDSNQDDKALLTKHSNTIFKEFKKLPSHSSLMVEAQLLLHAPIWRGEAVFAKVNDRIIWLEHYDSGETHDNCEISEETWQRRPISFNLQHKEDSVLIEFGTNTPETGLKGCEGLNMKDTVGLDDFVLYAK